MMNDPNDSVMLLGIIRIPNYKDETDPSDDDVVFYDEDIYMSSLWIPKDRKDNITGVDCIPAISTLVKFNDCPDLYNFVTSQPMSYLVSKELQKPLQRQITDNICVLLSLKDEDDGDKVAKSCLDLFKKTGFDYAMCETHIVYDVIDGCIEPAIIYSPFWVKKVEHDTRN